MFPFLLGRKSGGLLKGLPRRCGQAGRALAVYQLSVRLSHYYCTMFPFLLGRKSGGFAEGFAEASLLLHMVRKFLSSRLAKNDEGGSKTTSIAHTRAMACFIGVGTRLGSTKGNYVMYKVQHVLENL